MNTKEKIAREIYGNDGRCGNKKYSKVKDYYLSLAEGILPITEADKEEAVKAERERIAIILKKNLGYKVGIEYQYPEGKGYSMFIPIEAWELIVKEEASK